MLINHILISNSFFNYLGLVQGGASFQFFILKCIFKTKMCWAKIGLSWFSIPFWNSFGLFWETKKRFIVYGLCFKLQTLSFTTESFPIALHPYQFFSSPLCNDLNLASPSVTLLHCHFSSPSSVLICPIVVLSLSLHCATTLFLPLVRCSLSCSDPDLPPLCPLSLIIALSPSPPLYFIEVWFWCGFNHYLCWISKCFLQSGTFPVGFVSC